MSEGLLDHHPDARIVEESGVVKAAHRLLEEARGDLEVVERSVRIADRLLHRRIRLGLRVVALDEGHPGRHRRPDRVVDVLSGRFDVGAGVGPERLVGPVAERHADDRHVEEPPGGEAVERDEGHLPGEVAGSTEEYERVGA